LSGFDISKINDDVFFSVCGVQQLQRGGYQHMDFFGALWFVIVTFSTVGYGDYTPDIWPSQLFMMIMIAAALVVVPTQVSKSGVLIRC
jgi:potassium channel subfamily T protein 1